MVLAPKHLPEAIVGSGAAADQAERFSWDGHGLEPALGLALSGGGFRAMLFHAGALLRLNELGLLSRLDQIASVSGGSIAAGLLAARWPKLGCPTNTGALPNLRAEVVDPLVSFSLRSVDIPSVLMGLLPGTSAAEQVARRYRALVGDLRIRDMPSRPQFILCATNLQTGVLWRFTKAYAGDYVVGRLPAPPIPLATAMAASSAFPPFLSPLPLDVSPEVFEDWPMGPGEQPPPDGRSYRSAVRLTDGGVYDNHGLEPILKRNMTVFASDGGAPFLRVTTGFPDWLRQLRRVLEVTDNQVRSLRRRDLIARYKAAEKGREEGRLLGGATDSFARFGAYWGIGTDPTKLQPPDALQCDPDIVRPLAAVSTRLASPDPGVTERLVNWGYAVTDLCVRTHYHGFEPLASTLPVWPFPREPLNRARVASPGQANSYLRRPERGSRAG